MRIGLILPSWVYDRTRAVLAFECFRTLKDTYKTHDPVKLIVLVKPPKVFFDYGSDGDWVQTTFERILLPQPSNVNGTEQTLAYGTSLLFENPRISHVCWLGDDGYFHPAWYEELQRLILRHPDAVSYSVYRSSHVRYHAPLKEEGEDVLCKSLCGHGLTVSREEWTAWGINWESGSWPCPAGDTLDLHHTYVRLGERWCTQKSYIDHKAKEGVHQVLGTNEQALNFAGA
jgi:hypothetical protein